MRKIIQISVVSYKFFGTTSANVLYALCDDGTLWYRNVTNKPNDEWKLVQDKIPNTNV